MKALVAAILLAASGCGAHATFELTSSADNDETALKAALARRELPPSPSPINASGNPRVYAVTGGSAHAIVAFDLAANKTAWTQKADVQSRIAVGGAFIVDKEGGELVGRDQATGAVTWKTSLPGTFVGLAADRERAYAVWKSGDKWYLGGFDGKTGGPLWKQDAAGQMGAPAAQGGVVYAPFLSQWLSLVDGKTGKPLARVRGIDEQISMLRTTSTDAYFGSRQGVFELDAAAATGTRAGGTYAKIALPPQLERTIFGPDAYDAVQQQYTAADRAHVLWTAEPRGLHGTMPPPEHAPMHFANGGYAIHYFRFVFGYTREGVMRWAYVQPRDQLVASVETGGAIAAVSAAGDLVALDATTGAVIWQGKLDGAGQIIGATFDADGWAPRGQAEPPSTEAALVAIIRDHDARFDGVKELAVAALAKLPGGNVTKELLETLADKRAPQRLKDSVVDLLVSRQDPDSLSVLTAQLAVHTDFIKKTEPDALGPVAKAIGGLADVKVDPAQLAAAVTALQSHLDDPATATGDLVVVIEAMAAIGGQGAQAALTSHLLLYHADDDLGADLAWGRAIVHAIATHGGPSEHALLMQVAADPRTQPGLASAIHDALPGS